MSDKPIQTIVYAPVVSSDSNSQEAILARNTKEIQSQSQSDSKFDTTLERFCGQQGSLLSLTVVLSLFLLSALVQKRR
jgi:hypothetical protein